MNTTTTTETYSTTDVQNVVRRFQADLKMIADSTGAISSEDVANYVHDIELLAKKGYLASVDVTLLNLGTEVRAARYTVDTDAGGLVSSRPGNAIPFMFSGKISDGALAGEIHLGEYLTAEFTAVRANHPLRRQPIAIPSGPPLAT